MSPCRICHAPLRHSFCNLGLMPPSNSYLKTLTQTEAVFPLQPFVCEHCFLVQIEPFQTPSEIFTDYAYFSSFSESWIEHGKRFTEENVKRLYIDPSKLVIEIASNDGYLLQHFQARNIPVLGIEPARNVAQVAIGKGIPTLIEFFGQKVAQKLKNENRQADLLIANNVLAHVPNLHDFVLGLKILLKEDGVITLEFPHLLELMNQLQFDTIYHEHFSYFSLQSAEKIFQKYKLQIFDVEEIPTHGGSLRVFLQHELAKRPIESSVERLKQKEMRANLHLIDTYAGFEQKIEKCKSDLLLFLQKIGHKTIAGYGAAAKGNTFANFCHLTSTHLPFVVDKSPHKQGLYLPGSHIPIYAPSKIDEFKPDYLLILPWNLKKEIVEQMGHIRKWGGQFVTAIPELVVY